MKCSIDTMHPADWETVRRIYLEGIATGLATLETDAPDLESWDASHLDRCRLVARINDEIVGWAALSTVSRRQVYSGVAEVSVYVDKRHYGGGIGSALLNALISSSEDSGIWTLQAGIISENAPSLALHRKCGFREVGTRERIGKLNGTWRDVVLLERRSGIVGLS